jgi:hypothetical protein
LTRVLPVSLARFGRPPHFFGPKCIDSRKPPDLVFSMPNTSQNRPPPTMAPTASSLFSSGLGSSQLDAPNGVQRPRDFDSTRTEPTCEEEENVEPGLELSRLEGFELAIDRKRLKSFIWDHGWRLINDEGLDHWVCKKCHTAPTKPKRPWNHLFKTSQQTSGPIGHLRDMHAIVQPGGTPVRPRKAVATPSGGSRQASITGFTSSSARGSEAPFDFYCSCLLRGHCPSS